MPEFKQKPTIAHAPINTQINSRFKEKYSIWKLIRVLERHGWQICLHLTLHRNIRLSTSIPSSSFRAFLAAS